MHQISLKRTDTHLIKVFAGHSSVFPNVPHKQIKDPPGEEYLVHSGVVDLSGTVVKLNPHVLQCVPSQFDADGAGVVWSALRGRCFAANYAAYQAAGNSKGAQTFHLQLFRKWVQNAGNAGFLRGLHARYPRVVYLLVLAPTLHIVEWATYCHATMTCTTLRWYLRTARRASWWVGAVLSHRVEGKTTTTRVLTCFYSLCRTTSNVITCRRSPRRVSVMSVEVRVWRTNTTVPKCRRIITVRRR